LIDLKADACISRLTSLLYKFMLMIKRCKGTNYAAGTGRISADLPTHGLLKLGAPGELRDFLGIQSGRLTREKVHHDCGILAQE
jgi:hypothetical protein